MSDGVARAECVLPSWLIDDKLDRMSPAGSERWLPSGSPRLDLQMCAHRGDV